MTIKQYDTNHLFSLIKAVSEDVLTEVPTFADQAAWRKLIMEAEPVPIVGIMGEFSAGKSTFINALLGEEILQSDVLPTTAVVTYIKYGDRPKATAYDADGIGIEYPLSILGSLTAEGEEGAALRASIQYVELQLPKERLKSMTLVDTPGFNAGNEQHTASSKQVLERLDDALWLFMFGLVGKESERQSIQSLREQTSITPLGIINGIDKAEQYSSEPLDPIKYSSVEERKLTGYVRGMIGVSSLDALEAVSGTEEAEHWWEMSRFSSLLERLDEDHLGIDTVILNKRLDRLSELTVHLTDEIAKQMEQDDLHMLVMRMNADGGEQLGELDKAFLSLHKKLNKLRTTGSRWDELLSTPRESFVQQWIGSVTEVDREDIALRVLREASADLVRSLSRLESAEAVMLSKQREAAARNRQVLGHGIGRIKALFASKSAVYRVRSEWEALEALHAQYLTAMADLEEKVKQLADGFEPLIPRIEQMLKQRYEQLQNDAAAEVEKYRNKYEGVEASTRPVLGLIDRYRTVRRLQLKLGDYLSELEGSDQTAGAVAYEALSKLRQIDVYTDVADRIWQKLLFIAPDGVDNSGIARSVPAEWEKIARDALQRDLIVPDAIDIQTRRPIYWRGKIGWSIFIASIIVVILLVYYPGPVQSKAKQLYSQASHWIQSVFTGDSNKEREEQDEQPDTPVPIGYVVVIAEELNVRTTYSTSGEVVRKLSKGDRVDVIGESNGWLQIGINEWISGSNKYVQYTQLGESSS
ncbi:dynamin family protein [Paenibacillus xylaniclasticus]|uniref:dynamin family protein n=1 Tax=Paenibacillus xylaniclasticus TaxID=588083 RepID=UPI0013E0D7FA|nr:MULTISPECIES: dynamin family protein [Paenibacillus]GFN31623.1 hypothetical protein PCURB6_18830 [Paenibacillus curdlanolyticus]